MKVMESVPMPQALRDRLYAIFPKRLHARLWLVGGAVRDLLAGRELRDLDLLAALPAAELAALGFRPVEARTTVPIWIRSSADRSLVEVFLLQSDADVEDDLLRRDFTVNAMALGFDGRLYDPCGGASDLAAGRLRSCQPSSFADDPLRVVRALRFEAGGLRLDAATRQQLLDRDWNNALARLPVERFSRELFKALAADEPGRFFRGLIEYRIGENFLPELFRMAQVPAGPVEKHPEGDLLSHACDVLEVVAVRSTDRLARFCAFFHDLGKLATDPQLLPRHHGHEERGAVLADFLCRRLQLANAQRQALIAVCRLHGLANRWHELRLGTRLQLAEQARRARVETILPLLAGADHPAGGGMPGWEEVLAVAGLNAAQLGIDVAELECQPEMERAAFLRRRRLQLLASRRDRSDILVAGP